MDQNQYLYEITLILTEGSDITEFEKIVAKHAEVKKTTDLQVKQFAYPIGKLTAGNYVAIEFIANTEKIQEIEADLKGIKSLIRYLITKAIRRNPEPIRTGEYAKKPEVVEEPKTEKVEIKEEKAPEIVEEPQVEAQVEKVNQPIEEADIEVAEPAKEEEKPAEEVKPEPKAEKPAKKPRAKAEKVSAEELDKKLEELVKE